MSLWRVGSLLPQFNMLRMMVQRNPAMLQELLAEMNRSNPQLTQLINANQAEFLALINEPVPEGAPMDFGDFGGDEEMPGGLPPGAVAIELSQEEREAVDRLVNLGFDRQAALEAFLACDRNENLAANYLFDNGDE